MTLSRIIAATLMAGAVASPALADDTVLNSYAKTGSKGKAEVTLYGQVNVAAVIASDGEETEVGGVTNDNSQTRFGIKAKSKIGDGWKTGGRLEFEIEQIASDKFSQMNLTATPEGGDFFNLRRAEVFVGKGDWTLTVGQAKSASDGTLEQSVDPAKNVHSANIDAMLEDWGMAVNGEQSWALTQYDPVTGLPTGGTVNLFSRLQIEDVIGKAHDGAGRNFGARIDYKGIDGVTLMASAGRDKKATSFNDDITYALGAHVSKSMHGAKVKAGIGYTWNVEGNEDVDAFDVSVSALLAMGLMLTAAYEVELEDGVSDDPTILHLMAGYMWNDLCDWGPSTLSLGWSHTEDHTGTANGATTDYFSGLNAYRAMMAGNPIPAAFTPDQADSEGDIFSLTATQKVKAANLLLYAGFLHYEAELFGIDLEDSNAAVFGGKFKF